MFLLEQMDYLPLENLAADLLKKIQTLKSGDMAAKELTDLVSSSRDVYERLVILEFQALEKKTALVEKAESFKIDTETVSKTTEDAPISVQEKEHEGEIIKPIKIITEKPATIEPAVKEGVVIKQNEPLKPESESDSRESVAEKFENAPIENIAKSISLNEKFQFIRVLCGNNAQNFQTLLDKIGESTNEKEALNIFSSLISKPSIEEDLEMYEKFEELIKRRF